MRHFIIVMRYFRKGSRGRKSIMTEKELHKLRRHDLLQLLLAQGREAAQLRAQVEATTEELNQLQETNSRFIERMDDKDAQIGKLKDRLNEKDVQVDRFKNRLNEKDVQINSFKERLKEKDLRIDRLKSRLNQKDIRIEELRKIIEEYRSGRIFEMGGQVSIAEVGQKLEGIFTAAQKAVDQYLEQMGVLTERADTVARSGTKAAGETDSTGEMQLPESVSAKIYDAEEQNEEETDIHSGGSPHTGAAGGRTQEGTI